MSWPVLLILCVFAVQAQTPGIDGSRLRAHVRFLASDLLEGRAVGTRGGQVATQYLASALEAAGAKGAGEGGSFFQEVPLTGVKVDAGSSLKIGRTTLKWREQFVATTQTQEPRLDFSAPLVFAGHGIRAPEYGWDDYARADVRGKIVVLFTGEPPSEDPKFFQGAALTYYGRWSYKFEEATRQGAAGVIIIHTPETASYAWSVVENSWGREDIQLRLGLGQTALRIAGWITSEAAQAAGWNVEEMLAKANGVGFEAVPLEAVATVRMRSALRPILSQNVVARIEGTDPKVKQEHIVFSAHWDHLGGSDGVLGRDEIFNGAVDNATGCALLVELARAWAALSPRPRRSVLFLAVTAEESGLLGSEYYVRHPLVPLTATRLGINLDAIVPGGRPGGVIVHGERTAESWPLVEEAANRMRLAIRDDPKPEAGSQFRSDHFSFNKAHVAAYSLVPFRVPGAFSESYGANRYHQVSDEYSSDWDMTSNETMGNLALLLGVNAASRP